MASTRRAFLSAAAAALALSACAATPEVRPHRLIVHVDDNDPARMNLALNNISNVYAHYLEKNEPIEVELVAYGPGLHMLRADTSPVKQRLASLRETYDNIVYTACGNTMQNMAKAEGKAVALLPDVGIVSAGVTRIMELQEKGWSYVRP